MMYVFWDLETTSNDKKNCDIVSIACTATRKSSTGFAPVSGDSMKLSSFVEMCRPTKRVTPDARLVHGISDKELRRAPYFPDIWAQLTAWLGRKLKQSGLHKYTLVAHNGRGFDDVVISHNLFRYCPKKNRRRQLAQKWLCRLHRHTQTTSGYLQVQRKHPYRHRHWSQKLHIDKLPQISMWNRFR